LGEENSKKRVDEMEGRLQKELRPNDSLSEKDGKARRTGLRESERVTDARD
jgi:hypothetical protein